MATSIPDNTRDASASAGGNDYHLVPATDRQIRYARQIAQRINAEVPEAVQADRRRLSHWIDEHRTIRPKPNFSNYPSSKQVAFAERIARLKRRDVPPECFHDRRMMSRWIDSNL